MRVNLSGTLVLLHIMQLHASCILVVIIVHSGTRTFILLVTLTSVLANANHSMHQRFCISVYFHVHTAFIITPCACARGKVIGSVVIVIVVVVVVVVSTKITESQKVGT